jgi:hypothetical protein
VPIKQRLIGVVMAFASGLSTALLLVSGTTHSHAAAEADAVRPCRIDVPEAALVDLRRRVAATRWPD